MRRFLSLTAAGLAALMTAPALAETPSDRCDTEGVQAMAPADTTVSFAAREQGGCRVSGYVTTRNPGPNRVLFMLFLPNAFNGRYVYLGVGGAAGQLPSLPTTLLAKGYVLAGSDGGSGAKNGADFSFMSDPAKAMDFTGRGVQVTANATQQITRAYYKRDKLHRYISGCSGGGQMGLTNARKFGGQNFDGFLVGATPWPSTAYMVHIFKIAQHLQTHPEGWISPELMAKAHSAILAAYDGTDGAADGIIMDQRNIAKFDTGLLRGIGFTRAQIETFELISQPHTYSGPGLHGAIVNPGFPVTDISGWSSFLLGRTPPPWPGTNVQPADALMGRGTPFIHVMADTRTRPVHAVDYWAVKNANQLVRIATNDGKDIPYADPMDFSALAGSGAKMIVYHGVNDQAMSYLETIAGYEMLSQRFPQAASWVRAFAIPGMLHCRGGVGPTDAEDRLLEALVAWVETAEEPTAVVANRSTPEKGMVRSFLLCAEPTRARLKEPGLDPTRSASWVCR